MKKKNIKYPKIDLVYTWVDGNDSQWKLEKRKYMQLEKNKNLAHSAEANRYRNVNELKYSLRSVEKFSTFINNIYIVTNGQIPTWFNNKDSNSKNQKIKIIKHHQIMDSKFLPTFSSVAIEANLHKIPGLSEYFIYLNDDVFFGKRCHPENFLDAQFNKIKKQYEFKTKVFLRSKTVPLRSTPINKDDYYFRDGIFYTHQFLEKHIDRIKINQRYTIRHGGCIMQKSVLARIEKLLKDKKHWNSTNARFRKNNSIKLISLFYPYYALKNKNAIRSDIRCISVSTNFENNYPKILQTRPHMFCLNSLPEFNEQLRLFFKKYFPEKSQFEK